MELEAIYITPTVGTNIAGENLDIGYWPPLKTHAEQFFAANPQVSRRVRVKKLLSMGF